MKKDPQRQNVLRVKFGLVNWNWEENLAFWFLDAAVGFFAPQSCDAGIAAAAIAIVIIAGWIFEIIILVI